MESAVYLKYSGQGFAHDAIAILALAKSIAVLPDHFLNFIIHLYYHQNSTDVLFKEIASCVSLQEGASSLSLYAFML